VKFFQREKQGVTTDVRLRRSREDFLSRMQNKVYFTEVKPGVYKKTQSLNSKPILSHTNQTSGIRQALALNSS